jgi:hypothetical protein
MKDARGHGSDKTNGISVINPNGGNIAPKSNFQKFWAGSATQSVANDVAAGRVKTIVAGGGQPMSSNAQAAQSLMNGLKSTQAPVHDSMSVGPHSPLAGSRDYDPFGRPRTGDSLHSYDEASREMRLRSRGRNSRDRN